MAARRHHNLGDTNRILTVHFHQDGRTHCQRTGPVGSNPNSSRFAVRMAVVVAGCEPQSESFQRTMPPSQSVKYCLAHDAGIWETAKSLLQGIPNHEVESRQLSTLPMRMGGFDRLNDALPQHTGHLGATH